jgi:hypothetical protein
MHRLLLGFSALLASAFCCSGCATNDAPAVTANHRQGGSVCPTERGAGVSDVGTCAQSSVVLGCAKDGDCISGTNGRCLQFPGLGCLYACTYDECSGDSECLGNVPCVCRSSTIDSTANTCATQSNCRTDADCGPGGYCSPSLVGDSSGCASESFCRPGDEASCSPGPCLCPGTCGHGFFCHTSRDVCSNDRDCKSGACNFDLTSGTWMCTALTPLI